VRIAADLDQAGPAAVDGRAQGRECADAMASMERLIGANFGWRAPWWRSRDIARA
jgi:hypothetical protein